MKNLFHQTKQAFYFSLAFYLLAISTILIKLPFAFVLFSTALVVSMIWVLLVLREVLLSSKVSEMEKILLIIFVVLFNIVGGLVYFILIRERIIGRENQKR